MKITSLTLSIVLTVFFKHSLQQEIRKQHIFFSTQNLGDLSTAVDAAIIKKNKDSEHLSTYVSTQNSQQRNLRKELLWIQTGSDIEGAVVNNGGFGESVAISDDGKTVAAGAVAGYARIYRKNASGEWDMIGNIEGSGKKIALSADGNTIVTGGNNSEKVSIHYYNENGSSFTTINELIGEGRGYGAVDISSSGEIIAIGTPDPNNINFGYVQVYTIVDGTISQIGTKITGDGSWFGETLSISGDGSTLAVGNPQGNGKVVVFLNQDGSWVQFDEIIHEPQNRNIASFGQSLDLSEDGRTLAIAGSLLPGIVQIFRRDYFNQWFQIGSDVGMSSFSSDWYVSLSANGGTVAFGVKDENMVSIYHYVGGPMSGCVDWFRVGQVIQSEVNNNGNGFGANVALAADGKTIIIGDPSQNSGNGLVQVLELTDVTKAPSPTPTVDLVSEGPSTTKALPCNDSPLRFKTIKYINPITRGCNWVAKKATKKRCTYPGVSAHCPDTCNSCRTCVDSPLRFKKLGDQKQFKYCKDQDDCSVYGIKDTCRMTCNGCN